MAMLEYNLTYSTNFYNNDQKKNEIQNLKKKKKWIWVNLTFLPNCQNFLYKEHNFMLPFHNYIDKYFLLVLPVLSGRSEWTVGGGGGGVYHKIQNQLETMARSAERTKQNWKEIHMNKWSK